MKRSDVPAKYLKLYDRVMQGELSPRVAIRLHCATCCGWEYKEAVECTGTGCPLFRYRPGKTDDEKIADQVDVDILGPPMRLPASGSRNGCASHVQ